MAVRGVPLKKTEICDAIVKKKGCIKYAADYMGCSPEGIYRYMREDPTVQAVVDQARADRNKEYADDDVILVSKARESLHKLLEKGDVTATIFVCKTKSDFIQNENKDSNINVILNERPYQSKAKITEIKE